MNKSFLIFRLVNGEVTGATHIEREGDKLIRITALPIRHALTEISLAVNAAPYRPRYTINPDDPDGPVAA